MPGLENSLLWNFRQGFASGPSMVGFSVHATDGEIGKVDQANADTDASFLVISTGPWIFGKTVVLPAGVVDEIDFDAEVVTVSRSKDEIKNAPEYRDDAHQDERYLAQLGGYYQASQTSPPPG